MAGIFVLVVLLILHLSLYPWQFRPLPPGQSPLWILIHSWPAISTRGALFDVVANVVLYVPLGVSGHLALARRWPPWMAAAGALAFGAALSVGIEITQLAVVSRCCSLADVVSNACGTAVGIALAWLLGMRWKGWRIAETTPGALLVVACWVGFQTYPFLPDTSLAAESFSLVVLLVSVADWIALDALTRPRAVLALLFLLVAARPLIVGRTVSWPELAALPVALLARRAFGEAGLGRALFLAAALALNGLAPFRLAAVSAAFQWAPFEPLIVGDAARIAPILFLKAFRYGALIWLLRATGRSFAAAGAMAVVLLGLIETAQIWVGGHVPEVTDPLLAVVMALALAAFERLGPVTASSRPREIPSCGAPACRPGPDAHSAG